MKPTGRSHLHTPAWRSIVLLAAAAVVLPRSAIAAGENGGPPANTETAEPRLKKESAPAQTQGPATATSSDGKEPGSGNFVEVPITTNLQRARSAKYADAKVFVLINGMALFNEDDTVLNLAEFDDKGLEVAMNGHVQAGVRGTAIFRVCCVPFLPRPEHVAWGASGIFHLYLTHRVDDWFRDFDVEIVPLSRWTPATDWQSLVADITRPPSDEDIQAESGVGDDQVKVYPVRTPLSRYLYGDAYDCVIHIIPPIHEADAGILLTMQRSLAQLKLEKKDRACLLYHWKRGHESEADEFRDEFFGEQVYKDLLGFRWRGALLWW